MNLPDEASFLDWIFLRGLAVCAHVGPDCRSSPLEVDLQVCIDLRRAAATDSLSDTVDYADMAGGILSTLEARRFDNLADAAAAAADMVLSLDGGIREVSLTIRNSRTAMHGSIVELGISLTRKRHATSGSADVRRCAQAV